MGGRNETKSCVIHINILTYYVEMDRYRCKGVVYDV